MTASGQNGKYLVFRSWPHLFVLLFAFFAGAVSGFFVAFFNDGNQALQDYLLNYLSSVSDTGLEVPFLSAAWDCLRWPLFVLIFSFHPFGIVVIPTLLFVRSFLLSHAVFTLSFLLPGKGVILSIILFSVIAVFILPTTFLWGCEGFRSAISHRFSGVKHAFRIEAILIGAGILLVAIAVQWALIPFIFNSVYK